MWKEMISEIPKIYLSAIFDKFWNNIKTYWITYIDSTVFFFTNTCLVNELIEVDIDCRLVTTYRSKI